LGQVFQQNLRGALQAAKEILNVCIFPQRK
jgi:hypothetical protein